MNFLSPLSLIWFIPLGAIIVVLYLLKLRRKEHFVSSVMLWQDAVADIQANAPFQKLKKSLLLFLQLVALFLLVIAVARPYIRAKGITDNRIVIILDSSASMQSTDVSPSRFEDAKKQAISIVKKMGIGDTMLVMTAGSKARVVASFTSDKRLLESAISGLKPADTKCNMRQALVLALSLVAADSAVPPRVVVLSDGGFSSLTDLPSRKATLDYIRIGSRCDNIAITGLDSRKTLSGDQQVFVGLKNFSRQGKKFNLELYIKDQLVDIREESLRPGEIKQEILKDVAKTGGRVTAKIDIDDDLAVDNSGSVYLAPQRRINVLLISKGNVFLQNALDLDPRTRLTASDALPADIAKGKYDLIIFDRIKPAKSIPPGGYLLINTSSDLSPAEMTSNIGRPSIVDSAHNHPVSAYVDFSDVKIAQSSALKVRNWGTSILDSDKGPLAAAGYKDGRRFVQLSFDLLESDFPLHVGFPIFVANCLDWLVPQGSVGVGSTVRTGQPVYIDVPPSLRVVTITDPDGHKQKIKVSQNPLIYDNTEREGVYKISGLKFDKEFACNLASSEESDTMPRAAMMVGRKQVSGSVRTVHTNREFYGLAIFLVLAVLMFEWYAYHRRL